MIGVVFVVCRPTCLSMTPFTDHGSTMSSRSRMRRPFSSVRSQLPSLGSGNDGSMVFCLVRVDFVVSVIVDPSANSVM